MARVRISREQLGVIASFLDEAATYPADAFSNGGKTAHDGHNFRGKLRMTLALLPYKGDQELAQRGAAMLGSSHVDVDDFVSTIIPPYKREYSIAVMHEAMLMLSDGGSASAVAEALGVNLLTVGRWSAWAGISSRRQEDIADSAYVRIYETPSRTNSEVARELAAIYKLSVAQTRTYVATARKAYEELEGVYVPA